MYYDFLYSFCHNEINMYIGLRFSRFIIGFFALLWISSFANIDNLKGTYSILKQEYKEFSLVYGAIALQSDYLMHLYDYGTLGKKRAMQIHGIPTMVPDLSEAPAVVKLVHSFFYRVPGHMGRGDFVLTKTASAASLEDKTAIVKALAWSLAQVKRVKKCIEDETKEKKLKGKLKGHIENIPTGRYSIEDDIVNLRDLAGLARTTRFLDIKKENLRLFGLLWTAYQEEGKQESIFPPFSTDAVVLGIVYKIAGDNKAVLRSFYEKLNETLVDSGESIFNNPDILNAEWDKDIFMSGDVAQFRNALTFNATDTEQLRRSYEHIIYLGLLPGRYPKVAGYSTAFYSYNESGQNKQVTFADCMETTLRNLTNIILYNPETQEFDVSKIKNAPTQQLQDFYRAFKSATSVEDSATHNAWTAVVENIPFVSYNRETEDKTIKYELNPSLKNIILVFNHIFGLNLFESESGDSLESKTRNAVSRGDFIKVYFPQMCSSLGITCNGFFDNSGKEIELSNIDDMDYKDGVEITTKLTLAGDTHDLDVIIKTHQGHGELSVVDKSETNPIGEWLKNNFAHLVHLSNQNLSAEFVNICYLALCKNARDVHILSHYLANISEKFRINGIFYLPIENADYVSFLVDRLYSMPGEFVFDSNMFKLFIGLCENIPDNNQRMAALLRVYIKFIKSNNGQQEYQGAINIAREAIKTEGGARGDIWDYILALFKILFEKEYGYKDAIELASEIIESEKLIKFDLALGIFKALVEKGQGYEKAIEEASRAMELTPGPYKINVLSDVLDVFKALVEKGQGENVIEAVSRAVRELPQGNSSELVKILGIFQALVKQGKAYDKAVEAASWVMTQVPNNNLYVFANVLDVFKALVEKGHAYDEAIKAASRVEQLDLASNEYGVWVRALDVFKALVEKGQAYNGAFNATSWALELKSKDHGVWVSVLDVFKALVEKGKFYDEAINAASRALKKSEEHGVWVSALAVFKALVEKGQAYDKAIEAASQAINSDVWSNSLELFKVLVEKISSLIGPKYEQEIASVSSGIASDSYEVQWQAINLLKKIVKEWKWKQSSSVQK